MNKSKLTKIILASILTVGTVFLFNTQARADETQDLKNQVKRLQEKVDQLEKQLANQSVSTVKLPPASQQVTLGTTSMDDEWDPFIQMRMMQHQMNQMMRDNMVDFNPQQDIKQTLDHYIVSMDIPGMQKDKINVEVKSGVLVVSGERTSEVKEQKPNQFFRQERSFGHFLRTMPLPKDAKADNIEAEYSNGVLTVKVPRDKDVKKPSQGQKIIVK